MPQDPAAVIFRVAVLNAEYYGDDVVLAAMNPAGLDAFAAALRHALNSQVSHFRSDERVHTLQSHPGAKDVYLHGGHDHHVLWRLDPGIIREMVDKLDRMRDKGLCHNYVDIRTPALTLVLSIDEYLVPNPAVHTSPFGYF